ncbi:MAG TPA: amidase family protein, partial [Roseomonas sp.]
MSEELIRMTATGVAAALAKREVTPLELIDAAASRIAATDGAVNALPTLCLDRGRDHAKALMAGQRREAEGEAGWLGGLPVAIKDVTEVAGVRTTFGSPIFANHIPTRSHPVVERIERRGGIVIAKSNTPEFAAGGSTFNEVFGRTRNPWNTALTCGGSTGGGAVALATGQVWLAHGSDHGGSLRRPATYCGVTGLRPSPGRVTRGTVQDLFSELSVQGPMARDIPDLALFLDTMAGWDIDDPLTWEAPHRSYVDAVRAAEAERPVRIAFSTDFGGAMPMDAENGALCTAAARRFTEAGIAVEEAFPDLGKLTEAFLILRSQHFVVGREALLREHRDRLKPDIIWQTERGLAATPSQLAWAEHERTRFYRAMREIFRNHDVLVTPGASTPAFDVMLRHPETIGGKTLENYMAGSLINAFATLAGCPAVSVPCGFDQYGRPVGLQIVAPPRQDAKALQVAALFEKITGLDRMLPIEPRDGVVPPA